MCVRCHSLLCAFEESNFVWLYPPIEQFLNKTISLLLINGKDEIVSFSACPAMPL